MAITPAGQPSWARVNDHTAYGGDLNKQNYLAQDAVDPRTDITAQNLCRIAEDLAAFARMADFAKVTAQLNDTSPAAPTILSYRSLAPSSTPATARVADGRARFTWDDSYVDSYGVSHDIDIKGAWVTVIGSAAAIPNVLLEDTTGNGKMNRVTVWVDDDLDAAIQDAKICLEVD